MEPSWNLFETFETSCHSLFVRRGAGAARHAEGLARLGAVGGVRVREEGAHERLQRRGQGDGGEVQRHGRHVRRGLAGPPECLQQPLLQPPAAPPGRGVRDPEGHGAALQLVEAVRPVLRRGIDLRGPALQVGVPGPDPEQGVRRVCGQVVPPRGREMQRHSGLRDAGPEDAVGVRQTCHERPAGKLSFVTNQPRTMCHSVTSARVTTAAQ